jgi:hypothetical protein
VNKPAYWTAAYLLTRAIGLALLAPQLGVLVDFTHVRQAIEQAGSASAMPEYPWLAVALHELPLRLGVTSWPRYYAAMVTMFLLVDAAFLLCLWRAGARRPSSGFVTWLLVFPALGPLVVARFDIVAGALAAGALIALGAARPALAGALAAAGAGVKLWPALAVPALLVPGDWRQRRKVIFGLAAAALAIAAVTALASGAWRLWTPFLVQELRGLQLEAFAALPLLWARHFGRLGDSAVVYAQCRCYEIHGPAADAALSVASAAFWLAAAVLVVLHVRAWRAPPVARTSAAAAQLTALSVIAWTATSKVFSPQYLLWVAAPLAALGALRDAELRRVDIALLLAACALTQFLFPSRYNLLIQGGDGAAIALAALTLRDILLVVLGVRLAARTWQITRA